MRHNDTQQSTTRTHDERLIGKRELAKFLGKSEGTITRMVLTGTGPKCYRVGAFVRFHMPDVLSWLEQQTISTNQDKQTAA